MRAARWSLLAGNFVIGCGVMVVSGTLNDLTADLRISVSRGGELIALAALFMGVGAPLLAAWASRFDRRRLLTWTMVWYAVGHALCALAPDFHALAAVRALTVLSAAVFTPQAAATMGFMSTPANRGRHITFVFLGWSVASVAGMPITAWVGERLGWRVAMAGVAAGALLAAWAVHRHLPHGIRPPGLSWRSWRKVFRSPLLMAVVLVTACQSSGQFTLLAYIAPFYKQVFGASPEQISLMFGWFGALALAGNFLLNRVVDKVGAARAVTLTLSMMFLSIAMWPLASSLPIFAMLLLPWAISGFATNSGQQARLGGLSPRLAPALMALNTSAIYLGQALGAAGGSWALEHHGWGGMHWLALAWMSVAWALSWWAQREQQRHAHQRASTQG
ncbi:MAG: hypothetical protein RI907_2791 [Pseudomonadota bacterium]|jgi:predicted MFS family arabinose efflux permease